jgi:hypothetical protein
MTTLRIYRPGLLAFSVLYMAAAAIKLMFFGGDPSIDVPWIIAGALWSASAFRAPRPELLPHVEGPGPLAPTPTGRFWSGWPPSKDPDDYR